VQNAQIKEPVFANRVFAQRYGGSRGSGGQARTRNSSGARDLMSELRSGFLFHLLSLGKDRAFT